MLLVRSHPLGAGDYTPAIRTDRVRDLGSSRVADVTPLLPGLDALITDYSSLVFDAALVPLPVVFLAPGRRGVCAQRGFYGSYEDVAGRDWATDWAGAARQLDAVLRDEADRARRMDRSEALSQRRARVPGRREHPEGVPCHPGGTPSSAAGNRDGRTSMTDARFSTDGGATLIVSGSGPRPASVDLIGPRARVVGKPDGPWHDVDGRAAAPGLPMGRR